MDDFKQEAEDEASRLEFAALILAVGACAALLPGAIFLADAVASLLGAGL